MNQLQKVRVGCPRCRVLYTEDFTNRAEDVKRGMMERKHEDPKVCLDLVRKQRSNLETEILQRQKAFDEWGVQLLQIEHDIQVAVTPKLILPGGVP